MPVAHQTEMKPHPLIKNDPYMYISLGQGGLEFVHSLGERGVLAPGGTADCVQLITSDELLYVALVTLVTVCT